MSATYSDLTCAFPNSLDPNLTFSDVTSANKDLVNQYYAYKESGNDSSAIDILTQHPDLKTTIITHETMQLIYDMCIAQQRFYTSDVRNTLTTIVHYKGAFNETTKYSMFDLVTYNYRAYLCNSSDVAIGTLPTASGWDRITFQGESGTGMAFYTAWDSSQAYKVQDCVPYSNKLYVCIQANTNQIPLDNPTYWKVVITAPKQIIISPTQPENQDENDIWYKKNVSNNTFETWVKNNNNSYSRLIPYLTASDVGAKPDTYNPDLSLYQLKSKNPTAGKKTGTTLGKDATAEGGETTASGDYSHAEGYETIASGDGFMYGCHAEGYQSTASGYVSHAEGTKTTASGAFAHAEGSNTIASGTCAHAEGLGTTANNNYSHAMGMDNKTMDESKVTGDALTIGNGSKDSPSNCFRVNFSGNVYGLSSYYSYGADYSEFFEWQDENPNAEDRVGKLVTLDGEKIRYAKQGDDILGIVSALPAIIGDSPADSWKERYVTDVFGRRVTEEVTVPAQPVKTDENGVEIMPVVPEHTETRFKVNPNYDPAKENEYENREKRPEWSTVGMLGKLVLIDDGTCAVNGYCQPSTIGDGTATKSDIQTNCRVMARLDSTHIKVLLK